jgi:transcriptional regulator with XRE-family HTH domain
MARSFDHIRKILAQNIRALRDEGQLSQEELALRADVDRTYVSQIERAIGNPSLLVLCKLSAVLGVDVKQLFDKE